MGPQEMKAQAWGLDGSVWSFNNALLPPDIERFEPHLDLLAEHHDQDWLIQHLLPAERDPRTGFERIYPL